MKPLRYIALALATLLVSCQLEPALPTVNLQGRWVLVHIGDYFSPMVPGETFSGGSKHLVLTFQDETFTGYDGCNAFGGSYAATATALSFSEIGGTTRGCGAAVLSQAKAYFGALGRVTSYHTQPGQLMLQDSEGRTVLEFLEADANYEVTLQFKSGAEVDLNERSRVRIRVWGYDELIADAAATNLVDRTFDLPELGVKPVVAFAEEDLLAVTPSSGAEGSFGYYVTFAIDADGDGRVCTGDYRQNYDRTETTFFSREDAEAQNLDIFIQEITDPSECEAF